MMLLHDNADLEMRTRILAAAERLFRDIGYLKTTVADIARALKMSPANVYRFFDSKKAIYEGVARRLMGEVEVEIAAIAAKSTPPAARLRELLVTISRMNTERFVGDAKIHEMVSIAMEESWGVCDVYKEHMVTAVAKVIGDGVAAGVFKADNVALTAKVSCTAMMRFFHPQLIEQCVDDTEPNLDQMIDFVLASLGTRTD
jgi:AcrR family transcriptional regulator